MTPSAVSLRFGQALTQPTPLPLWSVLLLEALLWESVLVLVVSVAAAFVLGTLWEPAMV